MNEIQRLLEILDRLLGPNGCPWDREQTFESMRLSILDEAYEVVEAVDLKDPKKIAEELGDLLLNVFFYCKLGEKSGEFHTEEVAQQVNEKMIRRHPHIFGNESIETSDQLRKRWEEIKKEEKAHLPKQGMFDGIPHHLPSLLKSQKCIKKMFKSKIMNKEKTYQQFDDEETLGKQLFEIAAAAEKQGLNAELALNKYLTQMMQKCLDGAENE